MQSKTCKAVLLTGLFLLIAGLAEAVPPGPPFDPPGPPPWHVKRVRSVPIPATLLPFGIGLLALPWLYSKRKNKIRSELGRSAWGRASRPRRQDGGALQ